MSIRIKWKIMCIRVKRGILMGTLVEDCLQYGEHGEDAKWTLGTARNNQDPYPLRPLTTKPINYLTLNISSNINKVGGTSSISRLFTLPYLTLP